MIIHGRLAPGLVESGDRVQIRIHLPRKLAGVSLKLWELDTYTDRQGPAKRDPGGDVLLAQWDGALEKGDGKTPNSVDYCKFTASHTSIASADPDCFALQVVLPGQTSAVVVPVGGERTELAARFISLALSIEQGGAELFRTKSTCIARMPGTIVNFAHHVYLGRATDRSFDECVSDDGGDDAKQEVTVSHQWVSFGLAHGDGMQARLEIMGNGWIGADGVALDSDDATGQPIVVRKGRRLYAYVHGTKLDLAKGVSKIPLAACDPVDDDGDVIGQRPELADQLEVRVAELAVSGGDKPRFATDLTQLAADRIPEADEHIRAFAEAAKRFTQQETDG